MSAGTEPSAEGPTGAKSTTDRSPGLDAQATKGRFLGYTAGLGFALLLTGASFVVAESGMLWGPGVPIGLAVLAIAQMGVHLVFFLHIGTGPDNTNNVLALAFGVLVALLVIGGSIWIMEHLNENMMPTRTMREMAR